MEAALAVAALVAVLVLCIGALATVGAQIRCIDAAREAARLAARGDGPSVEAAVRAVGPHGAECESGGTPMWCGPPSDAAPRCQVLGSAQTRSQRSNQAAERCGESGFATILGAAFTAVLVVVAMGAATVGSAVVARHRAQAAADLAALAAAGGVPAAADAACRRAAGVAHGCPPR